MKLGDIVVVDFPFTNLLQTKVRPAVVVTKTNDHYQDVILCMISSVISQNPSEMDIVLQPSSLNQLRALSAIKVTRIATVQQQKIISKIGELSAKELNDFITAFQSLVKAK